MIAVTNRRMTAQENPNIEEIGVCIMAKQLHSKKTEKSFIFHFMILFDMYKLLSPTAE